MIDYDKIKNKLEKEYEENYKKIYNLSEKIGNIKCNDNDITTGSTILLSIFAWAAAMIAMPSILRSGILPFEAIQPLFFTVPLAVGATASKLMSKKFECKERLKRTTKAKSQKSRIEEATKLEIQKEKLLTANKVIEETLDEIESKKIINKMFANKTVIRSKEQSQMSLAEIENILELTKENNKQQKETIDKTATKKFLKEKFWRVRDKGQGIIDTGLFGLLGALGTLMIYNMPVIAIQNGIGSYNLSIGLLQFLTPAIVGGLLGTGYGIKRYVDYKEAFKKVNKDILGEDSLPETISDSERKRKMADNDVERFDLELEQQIKTASDLRLKLEEEKRIKAHKVGEKQAILDEPFPEFHVTEKTREDVLNHPELYTSCPPRIAQGKFYTDEEYEQYVQEILSRPLPGSEDKGYCFSKKRK